MEDFSLSRLDKIRYRPTREAEEFLEQLRRTLVAGEKFRVARLAIARSLVEPGDVAPVARGSEMAGAIEGNHLFGDDTSIWACLVVERADAPVESTDAFRQIVEAHWHRGARLLQADYEASDRGDVEFAARLATLAGPAPSTIRARGQKTRKGDLPLVAPLTVPFGEVGTDLRTGKEYRLNVNAPGTSPHLAIFGGSGSGKSRTAATIASAIGRSTHAPVLVIDTRGEFVKDGALVQRSEWGGATLAHRVPGLDVVDLGSSPLALDFLAPDPKAQGADATAIAEAFRDTLQRALRLRGEVATEFVRPGIELLLKSPKRVRTFDAIRKAIRDVNEEGGRKRDVVEAKLSEIGTAKFFEPKTAPADFFSRSWVIGLSAASDDARRFAIAVLFDALARWLLAVEGTTDERGYRQVRQVLLIDNARDVFTPRGPSVSRLLARGAGAGLVIALSSESPDDLGEDADAIVAAMGIVATFANTPAAAKALRGSLGRKLGAEQVSDKELAQGVALVKEPEREAFRVAAWR